MAKKKELPKKVTPKVEKKVVAKKPEVKKVPEKLTRADKEAKKFYDQHIPKPVKPKIKPPTFVSDTTLPVEPIFEVTGKIKTEKKVVEKVEKPEPLKEVKKFNGITCPKCNAEMYDVSEPVGRIQKTFCDCGNTCTRVLPPATTKL